jgi:hypothetical protein
MVPMTAARLKERGEALSAFERAGAPGAWCGWTSRCGRAAARTGPAGAGGAGAGCARRTAAELMLIVKIEAPAWGGRWPGAGGRG